MPEITNQLLVTVGGNAISALVMLAGGIFVLAQDWRRDVNRLFFFLTTSTLVYTVFFIIASLQTDYQSAYFWWFFNIFDVFIAMAVVHFIFRVIGKDRQWRWFIWATYGAGFLIFAVALLEPMWFLPDVLPKLYFPYYLDGGPWYVVMLVYFLGTPLVAFGNLIGAYVRSVGIERKRLEYLVLMLIVGYAIGCLNFFLVFNVPVDPIFGMFIGFYLVPIAYGIFSAQLLDVRLVARRALYYAVGIAAVTAFLVTLILLNDFLVQTLPWLEFWTVPLVAAIAAFLVGRVVWRQTKEADRLKYEFITIAAHRLRTPLTRIHWTVPELLKRVSDDATLRDGLLRIDIANNRLIELTNVLLEAAHTEDTDFWYKREAVDLLHCARASLARFDLNIVEKGLKVSLPSGETLQVLGDEGRLASVVDVLIENAVMYSSKGGTIAIALVPERNTVKFSVTDTGIGVKPEDRDRIFSGFYRTDAAKTTDTEGVGLGLSVAKTIVEKLGGAIGVESEGEGKGSTFWFTLPAAPAERPSAS
ncbi:MAG: ATP-binding protein [bacterium]|nr:ATP-binding protein [bacterium]